MHPMGMMGNTTIMAGGGGGMAGLGMGMGVGIAPHNRHGGLASSGGMGGSMGKKGAMVGRTDSGEKRIKEFDFIGEHISALKKGK